MPIYQAQIVALPMLLDMLKAAAANNPNSAGQALIDAASEELVLISTAINHATHLLGHLPEGMLPELEAQARACDEAHAHSLN